MPKRLGETSYKETAFGIIPRSKLIPLEIEGTKRAWDFILQQHAKGLIPVTSETIKKIHQIGFGWIIPEIGGRFRKVDVEVSALVPPLFYQVPSLMVDFFLDLKERTKHLPSDIGSEGFLDHLVSLLAWTHHRFLWIHPFQDYNGRLARLLSNVIMLNLDLPPIELKVETAKLRKAYIQKLQAGDRGDLKPLEKLFMSAIQEAAKEIKDT